MRKYLFLFLTIFGMAIIMTSCNHKNDNIDALPEVSFSNEVLPIFQTGCAISGCHDQSTAKEGEVYTNYENILSSVDPGNPDNSKSYKSMTNYFQTMPPDRPLSAEERTKVRVWILQGAKNN